MIKVLDGVILYSKGISPGILRKTENNENKRLKITINFDEVTGKNTKKNNPRWSQIPDMLTIHTNRRINC